MKRLKYLLIPLFFVPVSLWGSITGTGTSGDPYTGSIVSSADNFAFSGIVYFTNITVSGGTLTINPGSTVIATATNSYLIIDGTGVLNANGGTGANMITFTSNVASWARISFSSTSASIINYCIIEKGSIAGYGGGIYCSSSALTISNSIIRNCFAYFGGGMFIDTNASPSLTNCIISNNSASNYGGGIYFYQNSASVIQNCIFQKNSSAYGGGGVLLGGYAGNDRFFNCVFVSNTTGSSTVDNIYLFLNTNFGKPTFYNSIVWGGTNSITYNSQALSSNDFNNCAIQGYTSGYTNCINISGTNGDPTGPNFVDPTNADYSILFISPCRDAGVTTSPAVPNDIKGNPRVGNYDIGAYEVQYSRWLTTASTPATWVTAGNWEQGLYPGLAGTTGDAVIPYLANDTYAPNISSLTIASGKSLILEPGAKAALGALTNSGTLKLGSDATKISSLKVDAYSGNDASVELFLTGGLAGGSKTERWHYISSPVSSLASGTFAPAPTKNLAQYVSNRPSSDALQGWVAYDGYVYFGGGSEPANAFSSLSVGKGYDYYYTADYKFTLTGQLNTSTVNASLAYTSGNDALYGFNLLGNPFSCGLDWSQIIADVSFPANTSKGIYFTRDNVQCSYIGGVGVPGDVTAIIPPMQGFFTKTYSSGNNINLLASAKAQNGIHSRYKGSEIIPLVRLSLTENSVTDETVVRLDATAKTGFDYDFDALKMFIPATGPAIYSSQSGTNYSINGQPFPDQFVDIPIVVILGSDGTHKISATQLQGLDSYPVTLIDNTTGYMADLKTTPELTFNSSAGTIADRFILKVGNVLTGIENPAVSKNVFNIYNGNNLINIQTTSDDWDGKSGSVKVLDLTGKTISDIKNVEFSKNSLVQTQAPAGTGLYIVEIKSGLKRYVGKVVVK